MHAGFGQRVLIVAALLALLLPVNAGAELVDHSKHMAMMRSDSASTQSSARYAIPDVVLRNQAGEQVRLKAFLADSEPYALNFIFTTCTTICPMLTSSFKQMQRQLGEDAKNLQVISITIDPEYDTPAVLRSYAKRVRAVDNWTFLTGDRELIEQVEVAFNAFTADKMQHNPVYFFKLKNSNDWVRVDGLSSGEDLAEIYQANILFESQP